MNLLWKTWLPAEPCPDRTQTRLFCLPHAGGGTAMFHRWRHLLPPSIELLPVRLPGREDRWKDPPITDLDLLLQDLVQVVQLEPVKPFAIFGHSMGAIIAFQLTRYLRAVSATLPTHLFISSVRPPHLPRRNPPLSELPDEEMVQQMSDRYGDVAASNPDERQLTLLMANTIRADLRLMEGFTYHEEPPLELPIVALGGAEDRAVSRADLGQWSRHSSREFEQRIFPGGHFYLKAQEKSVATFVARKLSGR